MAYLIKEKFNLLDLAPPRNQSSKLVLIVEPEEYLLSLYAHYLTNHSFKVVSCLQPSVLHKSISNHKPDLLIVNTGIFSQFGMLVEALKGLRDEFRSLPMVTIGYNLNGQELGKLMAAGISSHIDRKLTRPMDLVHVVKVILNNDKN